MPRAVAVGVRTLHLRATLLLCPFLPRLRGAAASPAPGDDMGLGAGEGWDATGFVLSDGAAPPDIGAEDRGADADWTKKEPGAAASFAMV